MIAVVCVALLVIIFFLDSFNATVYSVGGKDIQDATDEARSIRDTYATARLGGIIVPDRRRRARRRRRPSCCTGTGMSGPDAGDDGGEDVDFEDLAGQ